MKWKQLHVWTDGSLFREPNGPAQGVPGPSGCAFSLRDEDGTFIGTMYTLGWQTNNVFSEGAGIALALDTLWDWNLDRKLLGYSEVVIHTDSKPMVDFIRDVRSGKRSRTCHPSVATVMGMIDRFQNEGIPVQVWWEKRDTTYGNQLADEWAKDASRKVKYHGSRGEKLERNDSESG